MAKDNSRETVATRVDPAVAEKLQTVVDAKGISKAEYLRKALGERLSNDHESLSGEDQIKAEINQLERQIEESGREREKAGLPDPLGLFN